MEKPVNNSVPLTWFAASAMTGDGRVFTTGVRLRRIGDAGQINDWPALGGWIGTLGFVPALELLVIFQSSEGASLEADLAEALGRELPEPGPVRWAALELLAIVLARPAGPAYLVAGTGGNPSGGNPAADDSALLHDRVALAGDGCGELSPAQLGRQLLVMTLLLGLEVLLSGGLDAPAAEEGAARVQAAIRLLAIHPADDAPRNRPERPPAARAYHLTECTILDKSAARKR